MDLNINNNNLNNNNNNTIIDKNNKELQVNSIINFNNKQILSLTDKEIPDYELVESKINVNKNNKQLSDDNNTNNINNNNIIKENNDDDFEIPENEEDYKNEKEEKKSGWFPFSRNNKNPKEKKLEDIKEILKSLNKTKDILNEDNKINIKKKSKDIFKIMDKDIPIIESKDINKFLCDYLFQKHNTDMKYEEKLKYFNILKIINNCIEIEKTKKIIKDFFKQTTYNEDDEDDNNIIDENNFIQLLKSNNDNYKAKLKENINNNMS
jgi:hypothetical protein